MIATVVTIINIILNVLPTAIFVAPLLPGVVNLGTVMQR